MLRISSFTLSAHFWNNLAGKALILLLVFAMLLPLCACGSSRSKAEPAEASSALDDAQSNMTAVIKSSFPLGLNARIRGVAATDACVFIGGTREEAPALVRMPYRLEEDTLSLGEPEPLSLPACPDGTQLLSLSCCGGRLYVLLAIPEDETGKALSYKLLLYAEDGSLALELAVDFPSETPLSILALEHGRFCVRGISHCVLYSSDGTVITALTSDQDDFYPPLLHKGRLLLFTRNPETGFSALNTIDTKSASLRQVKTLTNVGAPKAVCQSAIGNALISNSSELFELNADLEPEPILDWYAVTAEYGNDNRLICQLGENVFLIVPKDSAELKQLTLTSGPDGRRVVRIGFYGQSTEWLDRLAPRFQHYNPNYWVEVIDYGNDADGKAQLLVDIAAGDALDLVVSDCYQFAHSTSFVDLYALIDTDEELSREDFLPFILKGLERDGALRQIWSSFGFTTGVAKGPLAEGPTPLRLVDCRSYLDSVCYDGILFDGYYTGMTLLSRVADNLISDAYQPESGSYRLDTPELRELLALCRTLPSEEPKLEDLTEDDVSQVLSIGSFTIRHSRSLEEKQLTYRLFDGTDGSDNLTSLSGHLGECFMIPSTCGDIQNAWGFLKSVLSADFQVKAFADTYSGLPTNAAAFRTVMDSYASEQAKASVDSLIEHAVVIDYDTVELRKIFLSCLEPYLYGNYDLDTALNNAQGRMNLYAAEHDFSDRK